MVILENTPAGVRRMTRAGRSGEGMQPLSMEQGKPGKSRGVGESRVCQNDAHPASSSLAAASFKCSVLMFGLPSVAVPASLGGLPTALPDLSPH